METDFNNLPPEFWEELIGQPKIIEELNKLDPKKLDKDIPFKIKDLIEPPEPIMENISASANDPESEGWPIGIFRPDPNGPPLPGPIPPPNFRDIPPFRNTPLFLPIIRPITVHRRNRGSIYTIKLYPKRIYESACRLYNFVREQLIGTLIPYTEDPNTAYKDELYLYFICLLTEYYNTLYHELTHYYFRNFMFTFFLQDPRVSYVQARMAENVYVQLYSNQFLNGVALEEAFADANAICRVSRKTSWNEIKKIRLLEDFYTPDVKKLKIELFAQMALWGSFLSWRWRSYLHFSKWLDAPYMIYASRDIFEKLQNNIRILNQNNGSAQEAMKNGFELEPTTPYQFSLHPRTIYCLMFNLNCCLERILAPRNAFVVANINQKNRDQLAERFDAYVFSNHFPLDDTLSSTFTEKVLAEFAGNPFPNYQMAGVLPNRFMHSPQEFLKLKRAWEEWDTDFQHPNSRFYPFWNRIPLEHYDEKMHWDLFPGMSIGGDDTKSFPFRISGRLESEYFPPFSDMSFTPTGFSNRQYQVPIPMFDFSTDKYCRRCHMDQPSNLTNCPICHNQLID